MDTAPVVVINLQDLDGVKSALLLAMEAGNPVVPTPQQQEEPGSVILEAVGIKRWQAFEKDAVFYTIHRGQNSIDVYSTGRGKNGLWIQDKTKHKVFKLATPLCEVVNSIVADVLEQPESKKKEPSLPMLLPPPEYN